MLPTPKSPQVFTRQRDFWITAGGPVASLLLAVSMLFLGADGGSVVAGQVELRWIALAVGVLSFASFLDTAVPAPVTGQPNDGRKMLTNIREPSQVRWISWHAQLYGLLAYQIRLRDLPLWMLEEASREAAVGTADMQRAYDCLLVGIVLDSPPVDLVEARRLLNDFHAKHGENAWLNNCDAYFTAMWEGNAARAEALLWRGELQPGEAALACAAQAAVSAALGNIPAAKSALAEMRSETAKISVFQNLTFREIGRQIEELIEAQTVDRRPAMSAATA